MNYHIHMNRLRETRINAGLTQDELAGEAGCSRHAVMRLEQFCYPTPLPNIIATLSDISGLSENKLIADYASDLYDHRWYSGEIWGLAEIDVRSIDTFIASHLTAGGVLFRAWRINIATAKDQAISQIHFCNSFGIHPAVLSKYEQGRIKFPHSIGIALAAGQLDSDVINLMKNLPAFNEVKNHD